MTSVVIGGAGFIGSHLVDLLSLNGHDISIIDDLSTGKRENVPNYYIHKNDISYLSKHVQEILLDTEYVFLLAAKSRIQPSIETPLPFHRVNVDGLLYVLETLRKSDKLKKFVFSSSSSVYGETDVFPTPESAEPNPLTPYALQKYIAEQYIKLYADLYKVPAISLRYFNVYGERLNREGDYPLVIGKFLNQTISNQPLTVRGTGEQKRDFTYVKDVARANFLAAETDFNDGRVYNVCNSNPISINQVAEIFKYVLDAYVTHVDPVREAMKSHGDNTHIRVNLSWNPTVSLLDWLPKYLKGFDDK